MARILVTGGVGFIGYHLSSALLRRGDHVVILDDFSDAPYPTSEKERNARDLSAAYLDRVVILRGCITDAECVQRAMEGRESVVHLAGLAGVRPSFLEPAKYVRVNVEGTTVILEVARKSGIHNVVVASSSSVYGNATPLPANEDAPAVVPESPYAASKRSAELVADSICRGDRALSCTALRFFTVYGPRQRPEMAITKFARALLAGRPIPLFGDGSMRRDFTHVDDIVRGVLTALDRSRPGFRPVNLGSGKPVTLTELIDLLSEVIGKTPNIERSSVPVGDVEATFADTTRAREQFEWGPKVLLRDGLATVRDWLVKERD